MEEREFTDCEEMGEQPKQQELTCCPLGMVAQR